MPRRPLDAEFARRLFRDATSTSTRGDPTRRAFAHKVVNAVFDRAIAEDPERMRRQMQEILL
jgi:uncharacterized protein (DUF924 family)